MKVYIVTKGYWMYTAEIDKVFKNKTKANNYKNLLLKQPECHSYIIEREIEK